MPVPRSPVGDNYTKSYQTVFGGLAHFRGGEDGSIYNMQNMSAEQYPIAAPRSPRYLVDTFTNPQGICEADEIVYAADGKLYYGGTEVSGVSLTDGEKTILQMGVLILVFPDFIYYDTQSGKVGSMEKTVSASAGTVTFRDGIYEEEDALRNTLEVNTTDTTIFDGLLVNEAVIISGATHSGDNQSFIIREIAVENGHPVLRFYPETFDIEDGESFTDPNAITIKRKMPEGMSYPFVHENRLWGCWKDEASGTDIVGCSELGNPFNMFAYDSGNDKMAYFSEVLSPGDFTGACSFLGYPCFFKQDYIYKVYGSLPSDFQLLSSARMGVDAGAHKSLAIAGERLYYLSIAGIVQYAGSFPYPVHHAFGKERFRNAVAGSDGLRYYVSMQGEDDVWRLYVWDTQRQTWHIHDDIHVMQFAWHNGGLYALCADGKLWFIGSEVFAPEDSVMEGPLDWWFETGDIVERSPNRKRVQRVELRIELVEGSTVWVYAKFDDGEWEFVRQLDHSGKYSVLCQMIPRRCDHYSVKVVGHGDSFIHAMTRFYEQGSERH